MNNKTELQKIKSGIELKETLKSTKRNFCSYKIRKIESEREEILKNVKNEPID